MKKLIILLLPAVFGIGLSACADAESARPGDYTIREPITHKNLSVYLIESPATPQATEFLTLSEGLETGTVIVHETGSVGELSVENNSDKTLFIGAGEIVKGGRQDRILQHDMIVAAGSGPMPVTAFCVEQGRWSPRGDETSDRFHTSEKIATNKEIKLAARAEESQSKVWSEVAALRTGLEKDGYLEVRGGRSTGSLQLMVEDTAVVSLTRSYLDVLSGCIENAPQAIGFAFAINGELNSAEIYGSPELFRRMWPKLIDAAAVEATSQFDESATVETPATAEIATWLESCDNAEADETLINDWTLLRFRKTDKAMLFETVDDATRSLLHKSYVHE